MKPLASPLRGNWVTPRQGVKPRAQGRCYSPGLFLTPSPSPKRRGERQEVKARPGADSAISRLGLEEVIPRQAVLATKNVDTTTRNPLFLFLLFGLFLLRFAQRTFLSLLLNVPPRSTRCL
jgi:hypothetical protein